MRRNLQFPERDRAIILLLVFLALILSFFLTLTLSKVLTKPIQELTEITAKMVAGDLSRGQGPWGG